MPTLDPRIDAYIEGAPEFAQPLLRHWRAQVHAACPEVEETMKWSRPHFMYGGKILTGMSAFKAHCGFGFWNDQAVDESDRKDGAMGQLGRVSTLKDLPNQRELRVMIKRAAELIASGAKPPRMAQRSAERKPPPEIPSDLAAALKANAAARQVFEGFPPGAQREYVEWIIEAKKEETRLKRLVQAVEWIAEGKRRNWKYENC
ncbi:YdeI/OmpD-associated family protein [Pelomonas sp. SE-A7]|uniref:YdeI/OmpD-associated family protein n=1 Tax=Pelomonas sp. SE-A7 TaxID=3054953 RepID=UPI00259D0892|nr:YdeI/OmpD-associated family protein [Pelomonas sp. SE-A7]MDM4767934.1 YdeI/OmpD-associated family protein [Pelomonas sp. SE-A7]